MYESIRPYLRAERGTDASPQFCPGGHRLGPGRVVVGAIPCLRIGGYRRTHRCLACGAVIYNPTASTDPAERSTAQPVLEVLSRNAWLPRFYVLGQAEHQA
ncbi:hypothetical protein [Nocardia sp. NPDC023988]|uniref:hypothetical protein n=1 Tax=unclassified Nocardia TaxID=2637762 RepID=UPI0033EEAECC